MNSLRQLKTDTLKIHTYSNNDHAVKSLTTLFRPGIDFSRAVCLADAQNLL